MRRDKYFYRHILAAVLCFSLIFSGLGFSVFAEGDDDSNITISSISLGSKKTVEFSNDQNLKYYKFTVSKKGFYKIDMYNSYNDDFNDNFYLAVYKSKAEMENAGERFDSISGTYNYDSPDSDYEIYDLSAGTYYVAIECFNTKQNKTGIKISAASEKDLYSVDLGEFFYAGMKDVGVSAGYYDVKKDKPYDGKLISVKSSNKKVVKVNKETFPDEKGKKVKAFSLDYKKAGKAKITVEFKSAKGKKYKITKTIVIQKYPKVIKSLKVNGKKVKVSKNKFEYCVNNYKKTSGKVKLALKKGWKVLEVTADYNGRKWKNVELNRKVVKKGSKISFPKKYELMTIFIRIGDKDQNNVFTYKILFPRYEY